MTMAPFRNVTLPDGEIIPAMGQGTWQMADLPERRNDEIAALRLGIELGLTLIDTAEMYGDGRAEMLVGEAIDGIRESIFLVSKAYPYHGGRKSLPKACEASLRRLGTNCIDLYVLHWRGEIPLEETVEAFEALRQAGKIRHWGVSNFDTHDMEALMAAGGSACATNQIMYNLQTRGPELDLLPWLEQRHIPLMAYSPVFQGELPAAKLAIVAARHAATPAQIALAWLFRRGDLVAIPKATRLDHIQQNRAAFEIDLSEEDLTILDDAFPRPADRVPLAISS